jgi:hypothetical protein
MARNHCIGTRLAPAVKWPVAFLPTAVIADRPAELRRRGPQLGRAPGGAERLGRDLLVDACVQAVAEGGLDQAVLAVMEADDRRAAAEPQVGKWGKWGLVQKWVTGSGLV